MERTLSTQTVGFLRLLRIVRAHMSKCLEYQFAKFYHQFLANFPLNATEIVKFLKTHKIWGIF